MNYLLKELDEKELVLTIGGKWIVREIDGKIQLRWKNDNSNEDSNTTLT